MKCPNCENELSVPTYAVYNAEAYGKSVLVKTICCATFVRIAPVVNFRVEVYEGDRKEDDWGNERTA